MTTAQRSEIKNNNKLEALFAKKKNLHVHHVNDFHSIFYALGYS